MISIQAAQHYYTDHDTAHGFDHVLRVWRLAERIGREEGADLEILQGAALLHDVGRAEQVLTGADHAAVGAARAREILAGQPPEKVERVARCIAEHRFRVESPPSSLEAQVLFDADKLDALGAVGVARAYAAAGEYKQRLWAAVPADYAKRPVHEGQGDLESGEHTPVHEFEFKLVKLRDRLYTAAARRLAEERHAFMVAFFARLADEVQGKR
jgi:uncharacterized protein